MMRQLLLFAFLSLQVTDTLEEQGRVFLEALVKKDLLPANSAGTVVISDQAKEDSTLLLSLLQEETHGPTAAYDLAEFENQDAERIPGQTFIVWLGNQDSLDRSVSALESHQSPESKYLFLLEYNADLEYLRNSLEATWLIKARFLSFAVPSGANANFNLFSSSCPTVPGCLRSSGFWNANSGRMTRAASLTGVFSDSAGGGNFGGANLRVTTFDYEPKVYGEKNVGTVVAFDGAEEKVFTQGYEIKLVDELAKRLNFVPSVRNPSDGNKWGAFIKTNGTFNGLSGDLQFGRTDMGVANLFLRFPEAEYVGFTYPYSFDRYCFLVTKPPPVENWLALVFPFTVETWICVITTTIISTAFLLVYNWIFGTSVTNVSHSNAALYMVAALFDEPFNIYPRLDSMRFFLCPVMLGFFTLTSAYSGSLFSFLTVPGVERPVDTIEGVAKMGKTVGNFAFGGFNGKEEFLRSPNPSHHPLASDYSPYRDFPSAFSSAASGNLIMLEAESFVEYILRRDYTDRLGRTRLHVVSECWSNLQSVAAGVQRGSPIQEALSDKIGGMREAGLLQKWIGRELDKVGRLVLAGRARGSVSVEALQFGHLRVPMALSGAMAAAAAAVFAMEAAMAARRRIRERKRRCQGGGSGHTLR